MNWLFGISSARKREDVVRICVWTLSSLFGAPWRIVAVYVILASPALISSFTLGASAQEVASDGLDEVEQAIETGPLARRAQPRIRVGLPIPHGRNVDNTRLRVNVAEQKRVELPTRTIGHEPRYPLGPTEEAVIAPEPNHRALFDNGSHTAELAAVDGTLLEGESNLVSQADYGEPLEPIFESVVEPPAERRKFLREWFSQPLCQFPGVGYQRLPLALFEMDTAIPNKALRFRVADARNHEFPDRAEYFWAKAPGGIGLSSDAVETAVNYQDLRIQMETGSDKLSVVTELPIRFLDPEINPNTTGLADMSVGTKSVLKQTENWTLSQITRTYMNTGAVTHGLSTGHVSMEPGLLFTKRMGRRTQFHSELKYWFPIAGDPDHSGQILRYGVGASRIFRESDSFAIVPTFEAVGFTVLDGQKTTGLDLVGDPVTESLDGETIVNIYPGVWFIRERKSLLEVGCSGGLSISNERFFETIMRLDIRIAF